MTATRSTVAPFSAGGLTWICWVLASDHGFKRYEWRTADGRCAAWRDGRDWNLAIDGRVCGTHPSLMAAMTAVKLRTVRAA